MFDIRTVLVLTVIYNYLLGFSILAYNYYKKIKNGNKLIGNGLIFIGSGFLLLSLRNVLPQFATVIISNVFIVIGDVFLLTGLNQYTKKKLVPLYKDVLILLGYMSLFIYFTYVIPNINNRIIIAAIVQIYYFAQITITLYTNRNETIKIESRIVSIMFVIAIMVNVLRLLITLFEPPLNSFMSAGFIHSIAILIYQVIPFNLTLGIFWMDNTVFENELETQAMTDGLTGMYNRVAFLKIVSSECKRAERYKGSIGIVMCDIDYFKSTNDTYGHQAGDLVLQRISTIFSEHIRSSDIVGRYGGEEFILALIDVSKESMDILLDKIRRLIEDEEHFYKGHMIKSTMSFGATLIKEHYNLTEAVYRADMALYRAKQQERNCICFIPEN